MKFISVRPSQGVGAVPLLPSKFGLCSPEINAFIPCSPKPLGGPHQFMTSVIMCVLICGFSSYDRFQNVFVNLRFLFISVHNKACKESSFRTKIIFLLA